MSYTAVDLMKRSQEVEERRQHHTALDNLPDFAVGWFSRFLFRKRLHREKCRMCEGTGRRPGGLSEALIILPEPCRTCCETGRIYVPRG